MSVVILGINGSPRKQNNSSLLLEHALKGATSVEGVTTDLYEFAGKDFLGCRASCMAYCMKNGKCSIRDDDFNNFMETFLKADGVIWSAPVYHVGPPAQVKCAIDRLGNVLFSYLKGASPRLNKPCAAMVQGSTRWGGQELAIQFFIEHFMLMKCIPITGDMPNSYFGVAGHAPTWKAGSIVEDSEALGTAENTGVRVAEFTKIVKAGINQYQDELPESYFLDKVIARRLSKDEEIDMEWQKK